MLRRPSSIDRSYNTGSLSSCWQTTVDTSRPNFTRYYVRSSTWYTSKPRHSTHHRTDRPNRITKPSFHGWVNMYPNTNAIGTWLYCSSPRTTISKGTARQEQPCLVWIFHGSQPEQLFSLRWRHCRLMTMQSIRQKCFAFNCYLE